MNKICAIVENKSLTLEKQENLKNKIKKESAETYFSIHDDNLEFEKIYKVDSGLPLCLQQIAENKWHFYSEKFRLIYSIY